MAEQPTVYAVYWPEINVVKVGYSGGRRWRTFTSRGAQLLQLLDDFTTVGDALDFEAVCHLVLEEVCHYAFRSAAEAAPYLGNNGGGHRECFKVPADLLASELLPFINSRLEVLHAQA